MPESEKLQTRYRHINKLSENTSDINLLTAAVKTSESVLARLMLPHIQGLSQLLEVKLVTTLEMIVTDTRKSQR